MTDLHSSIATRSPAAGGTETVAPELPARADGDDSVAASGSVGGGREVSEPSSFSADSPGRTFRVPDIPVRQLAGLALVGVGVLIVLFLVYLFAFTPLSASRDQQQLAQSLTGGPHYRYGLVAGHTPPEGAAIGVLDIPALQLDQIVVQGTSAADLMKGPGLMPGSALPGSPGNSVIAGRRVTFGGPFAAIGQLRIGDLIHTVDGAGTFNYRVSKVEVVTAGQRDVVTPTATNRLTLVTSNSSFVPDGRLVVLAKLVGPPVAVPTGALAIPGYELGLSGDPVAGGLAVMWSILTILVLIGAGLAVWRWRRPWLIYLFAAPLVVACGLFACEAVARALPATL